MTPYSPKDLSENWEFKILRSATGKFRDPMWLHAILAEETRAGWSMVEKFDDTRVRLKRPSSARKNDAALGFDPYRIWVGVSPARFTVILLLCIFAGAGLIVAIVATIIALSVHGGR
jgi:hypothetical protein